MGKTGTQLNAIIYISEEEELGSSEESGKDWDELEAEARKGKVTIYGQALWLLLSFGLNAHHLLYESCHEKTCLWGFGPDPTQIRLYRHRRWPEA